MANDELEDAVPALTTVVRLSAAASLLGAFGQIAAPAARLEIYQRIIWLSETIDDVANSAHWVGAEAE